ALPSTSEVHLSNVWCHGINGDARASGLIGVRNAEFLLGHFVLPQTMRPWFRDATTSRQGATKPQDSQDRADDGRDCCKPWNLLFNSGHSNASTPTVCAMVRCGATLEIRHRLPEAPARSGRHRTCD